MDYRQAITAILTKEPMTFIQVVYCLSARMPKDIEQLTLTVDEEMQKMLDLEIIDYSEQSDKIIFFIRTPHDKR